MNRLDTRGCRLNITSRNSHFHLLGLGTNCWGRSMVSKSFHVLPIPKIGLARLFHELLSRNHETGNPLAGLSGAERAQRGWACLPAIASLLAQARRAGLRATRPAGPRAWFSYLNGTSQGELVLSVAEGTPEDARKNGYGL
jgi:hypothetical protein